MRTQLKSLKSLFRGTLKGKQICFIGEYVKLGRNVKLSPMVFIDDYVSIGSYTFIGYSCIIRPGTSIGKSCSFGHLTVIEGASIGARVGIHAQCHITKGTIIEDDVFFAAHTTTMNVKYMDHGRGINPPIEAPIIKRAARIGGGVSLMPGIVIGENAVIGGGSLVTKNVPAGEIWFGSPAKKMGEAPEEEWL